MHYLDFCQIFSELSPFSFKNDKNDILQYFYTLMTGFSGTFLLPQEGITFHNIMFSQAVIFIQSISEMFAL